MNVVDSSGWLEYFAGGPGADFFAAAIASILTSGETHYKINLALTEALCLTSSGLVDECVTLHK